MSLNCLTCAQIQRTDSYREYSLREKERAAKLRVQVERSWSGTIVPPDGGHRQCHDQQKRMRGGPLAKIKTHHRRIHSAGEVSFPGSLEPRLVRSCGVRRDWSFEDLMSENPDNRIEIH